MFIQHLTLQRYRNAQKPTYDLFENLNEEARLQLLKYMISTNAQLIINDLDMVKGMENFNVIEI